LFFCVFMVVVVVVCSSRVRHRWWREVSGRWTARAFEKTPPPPGPRTQTTRKKNRRTGLAKDAADQHRVDRLARLLHAGRDDDALARRQPRRLDDDRRALGAAVGLGGVGVGERLVAGGRDVVLFAQVLFFVFFGCFFVVCF
jgi:hypothetical protein